VQCGGGTRSVIAITLLKREGFDNLINLTGGFSAYKEARGACLK
jgi:hydroxyacylglutathione hydrolase